MNPPDINVPLGVSSDEKKGIDRTGDAHTSSTLEEDEFFDEEEEDFDSLLQPTRWWMTSTAFPLLAVCIT